jgi:hypothetical protein
VAPTAYLFKDSAAYRKRVGLVSSAEHLPLTEQKHPGYGEQNAGEQAERHDDFD